MNASTKVAIAAGVLAIAALAFVSGGLLTMRALHLPAAPMLPHFLTFALLMLSASSLVACITSLKAAGTKQASRP